MAVKIAKVASLVNCEPFEPTVLDCRGISHSVMCSDIKTLVRLLQSPFVKQLWILKVNNGSFLELKGRIQAFHRNGIGGLETSVLKLSQHDADEDEMEALQIGQKLMEINEAMSDLQRLSNSHPGLLKAMINAAKEVKNRQDGGETSMLLRRKRKSEPPEDGTMRMKRKTLEQWRKFASSSATDPPLNRSFKCYVCKKQEKARNSCLCVSCFQLNADMKNESVNLKGRYAIVTGGRIKIGFHICLRLLRNDCHVVCTTRFPGDALSRFKTESDFQEWNQRLRICYLDLERLESIHNFLTFVHDDLPHLDILINNAAQTIHRPASYYKLLDSKEEQFLEDNSSNQCVQLRRDSSTRTPSLSHKFAEGKSQGDQASLNCFPEDKVDQHGEQLDLRLQNSWTYTLNDVPLSELLQVLAINTVGPFILTSQLKSMLMKSPFQRRFVVNVSAMEGQFSRWTKGHRHPHTNMAKAALNMLTRTSGMEFKLNNIFMTAVDTGWITDERPHSQAQYEAKQGFQIPLSCDDGAARVLHPIFHGISNAKVEPFFAVFLKDYRVHPW